MQGQLEGGDLRWAAAIRTSRLTESSNLRPSADGPKRPIELFTAKGRPTSPIAIRATKK